MGPAHHLTAVLVAAPAPTSAPAPAYFGSAGQLVAELAAVVGGLALVLGVVWRVLAPHVRSFVAEQTAAARQLQPDGGDSALDRVVAGQDAVARELARVADTLGEHDRRLVDVERQLGDHLRHAAVELSMLRAVCAAAGVELVPRPPAAPRRRWYDDDDPTVTSWEVRPSRAPTTS